ncbi:MAG: TonB-dependent receptor [Tannerella sp.]|nr:TonB-dependent receptor [Tannerella sp.]
MHKKSLFGTCMCLVGAWFMTFTEAWGQETQDTVRTRQLRDVEVVGQRRVSTSKQATPLQVIDNKAITRLGIHELSEAVKRFSGVTVKDYGGVGGLKTVSIRSLGAQHTAVSYDGVSISDAQSGQVDISRFTLDNVEMVSLTTGQSDNIFRTARAYASAGVLDITTKKPRFDDEKPWQLTAKFNGGSFGLVNPFVSGGLKLSERSTASLHSDFMRADGNYPFDLVNGTITTHEKRINSDIKTVRIEGNTYSDIGGGLLNTKIYVFKSKRGLPGAVNYYDKTATERLWNDNAFAQAHYRNAPNKALTIQVTGKYTYSYSRYRNVSDNYAAGFQEDRNTQHEIYTSAGALLSSSEYLAATLTTDYIRASLKNNFLNAKQPVRNTSLTVFALQFKNSAVTATGSLLATYITDKVQTGEPPSDRKRFSPAAAISWKPFNGNALRIRLSYQDIFRVPTFTDLYYLRTGNTNLKPEKARQYNVGLTWSGSIGEIVNYLSLTADGYYNKVDDKIVAIPTMYIWKMMNMGEVEIRGADVNATAEIPLSSVVNINIQGNYTYQHAIDLTDINAKNYRHQIPYTPRHTGGAAIAVENPWVNVSYTLTAVGDRYALPQNIKTNRIDGYIEQGISLNKMLKFKRISIRIRSEILNITNEQYDVIQFYPMPGRSWRLGMTIDY